MEELFSRSDVVSVIVGGPALTPLPYLADPKEHAKRFGVTVLDSDDIGTEDLIGLASQADVGISLGCNRILRKREIEAPRLGTFNLHPSALPEYRGLHPDLYAIMDGQKNVGVTLHRMDTRIDTGPIVAQRIEVVSPDDTVVSLTDRLYSHGASLLGQLLTELATHNTVAEYEQPKSFDPLEIRRVINWNDSAWRIANLVRALTFPWPMAKTNLQDKTLLVSRIRVVDDGVINPGRVTMVMDDAIRVGTGGHSVDIQELRDEVRKILPLDQLVSELRLVPGETCFGDDHGP